MTGQIGTHFYTLFHACSYIFKNIFLFGRKKNRKLIRVHWSTKCPDIRFEYFPSFNILFILGAKRKWRNYCYLRILFILLALVFPNLRFLLYRRQKKPKSIQHFLSSFQSFCTISLAQSLISLVADLSDIFSLPYVYCSIDWPMSQKHGKRKVETTKLSHQKNQIAFEIPHQKTPIIH